MTAKQQALIEQAKAIVNEMEKELQTVMRKNRDGDLIPLLGRVAVQQGRMRSLLIYTERGTPYPYARGVDTRSAEDSNNQKP